MEKYSLDRDWKFYKGDIKKPEFVGHTYCYMAAKAGGAVGAASPDFNTQEWQTVNLPHDWAVYGEFDERYGPAAGYKPRGTGWYTKRFRLEDADKGKQIIIEFGGIASHAIVYCNGSVVGRNFCGYNSFIVDITDMAVYGDQVNTLCVYVDATIIEGWWYEGAGIYRHVNLYKKAPVHIKHWGIFVKPEKKTADVWNTNVEITIENSCYEEKEFIIKSYIKNQQGVVIGHDECAAAVAAGSEYIAAQCILVYSPELWDIDDPNLYTMLCEVYDGEHKIDENEVTFGYRTIEISPDYGFHLNGRRVNLYGTCNHQDHAGVGVAVPDRVNEYRIQLLKEMGSNAYRCAHGNPTPEILDYCDRYGILVMDENRNFNSSPEGVEQTKCMVLRDRNHPCVIMYSIFNEEPLQGTPTGRKLAEKLACEIRKLDNTRFLLGAMNTGVLEDSGCADLLDITGFNYINHMFDPFRERLPAQPMLGSENDSAFQTRGVYHTDYSKHIIDSYDTEKAHWGNTYRDGFKQIDTRKHIMGLFIWTGFDYRGEPTPFEWPSIGTQFGIMDTCGFKKDAFYLNQAFFTKEPMIHVLPHWNWQPGEQVKVMVHTNCMEAELILNGISQGRKSVDKYDMAEWMVQFEPGTIQMIGYRDGEAVCEDVRVTSGRPAKIILEAQQDFVYADCMDAVIVNASVTDENGILVPDANNLVTFHTDGAKIIGVGNGDPNSHESDKVNYRHLFHGFCQMIAEQTDGASQITITAESDGLTSAVIMIPVKQRTEKIEYIPSVTETYISTWRTTVAVLDEKPDPTVKIEDHDMNTWGIIQAGSTENKYEDKAGFGLYKTTCKLMNNGTEKAISFREITGSNVEIYIDNELKFSEPCEWGRRIEIPLDKTTGEIEIAVIIQNKKKTANAGITKCVVLIDK